MLLQKGEAIRTFHPDLNLDIREWFGAVLADREGRIIGVVGRKEALSDEAAISVLKSLPPLEAEE